MKYFKILLLILCAINFSSCSNGKQLVLVGNLNQDAANNILLELGKNNIDASKQMEKGGVYQVVIASHDEINALTVLKNNGLPDKSYSSLGDVFKKDSFISSPTEEQSRLIYALDEQISQMLLGIDGVVEVNTQVSLPPSVDNLWQGEAVKPAAAVLLKYRSGYRVDLYLNKIKQLVANAVPGLTPERVEVLIVMQQSNQP